MRLWCNLFGHNYSITSSYGNYAFCSRCGAPLTIKEPHVLTPGERRWIDGKLMEMNEFNMLEEVVKDDRQILKEDTHLQAAAHQCVKRTLSSLQFDSSIWNFIS